MAELDVVEGQLVEIAVRQARLEAEQADLGDMPVSNRVLTLVQASQDGEEQLLGQRALFKARRLTLAQQLAQISERIRQSGERISGAEAQLASLVGQAELVSRELGDQELLLKKGLVQRGSVISLQRQQLQLAGDIGRLRSEIAQQKSEIAALKLEALRLEAVRREDAIVVLRDLSVREMELLQQRRDIRHRLDRMTIKAPVSGVVHGATIDNPGAVIKRAETLMLIVPQDQPLRVSARVAATDVDQISVGQPVSLKLSAFSMRSTPEITGETLSISPDAFTEDATGQRYYAVEISADLDTRAQSKGIRLVPGMPVDAFFETAPRTPISFLMQPLTDYLGRALREG